MISRYKRCLIVGTFYNTSNIMDVFVPVVRNGSSTFYEKTAVDFFKDNFDTIFEIDSVHTDERSSIYCGHRVRRVVVLYTRR